MKLNAKLAEIIGHLISIHIHSDKSDKKPIEGELFEVGDNYIVVNIKNDLGESIVAEGQWFIPLSDTLAIYHGHNCSLCNKYLALNLESQSS
ncbi:hypothetical protein ACFLUG_04765 [Chloroflexota bacterium]